MQKEPVVHSHITDELPDDHPLAYQQVGCAVCGCLVHAGNNECMVAWCEFAGKAVCAMCFAKYIDESNGVFDEAEFLEFVNSKHSKHSKREEAGEIDIDILVARVSRVSDDIVAADRNGDELAREIIRAYMLYYARSEQGAYAVLDMLMDEWERRSTMRAADRAKALAEDDDDMHLGGLWPWEMLDN